MAEPKFMPRQPEWLFTHKRVELDHAKLANQADNVMKLEPNHPFRLRFLGVLELATDSQTQYMMLGPEINSTRQARSRRAVDMVELKVEQKRNGFLWRESMIKLSLLSLMCRDVARDRTLDEVRDDAMKHLSIQAEAYDDMEKPASYLPRPFVGSDMYRDLETFILQSVMQAQNYQT